MATIISQMFLCLFLAAAIGFVTAWLLRNVHWSNKLTESETRWNEKTKALELERSGLQSSLEDFKGQITEGERKIQAVQAEMVVKTSTVARLEAELSATGKKLSEAEKERQALQSRLLELEPIPGQLKDRNGEIARLGARITDLETFPSRLQEKEKKLREVEERFQREIGEKVSEVAGLKKKVAELEITALRLEEKDKKLVQMDALLQSAVSEKQGAIETLKKRVGELGVLTTQLGDKDNRLREMDAMLTASAREKEMEVQALRKRMSELELKAGQIEEKDRRVREMDALLESAVRDKDGQIKILERRITELEPVLKQLEDKDDMLRALDMSFKATTSEKDEQIDALKKRLGDLQPALIAELKQRVLELAPLENRVIEEDKVLKGLRSTVSAKDTEITNLMMEVEKLKLSKKPRTRRAAKPAVSRRPVKKTRARDDLKTIRGIGPVIERTLNRLGVRTYRQIAKWTKADIDRVSAKLTAFKDRIQRESWIKQAREAHFKKYGKRL